MKREYTVFLGNITIYYARMGYKLSEILYERSPLFLSKILISSKDFFLRVRLTLGSTVGANQ